MNRNQSGALETDVSRGRATSWEADATFLTRRPNLGTAWVVDLKGTSTAMRLFLRTLQGTINRTEARLYLINSDSTQFAEAERFWIEEYDRRGWITVGGHLSIAEVVDKFGDEVAGFVAAAIARHTSRCQPDPEHMFSDETGD